ncbi:MAG: hypothetical protein K9H16_12355 [Bacteroidales bacterium]|nr:hypothetical protein [Bacteroidales bacterium]
MKLRFLLGIFFFISTATYSQNGHQNYLQGYAGDLGGKNFGYHSPLPDINERIGSP